MVHLPTSDGERIARLLDAVRAAVPNLALEAAELTALIARAEDARGAADTTPERAVDMAVALGAARSDDAAVKALAARLRRIAVAVAARARLQPADEAELEQTVLRRLLVGVDGTPPKIAGYAEHGDLDGLLFVAASRVAIELARGRGRQAHREAPVDPAVALVETDAELRLLSEELKYALTTSMRAAIRGLSSQDRNMLRLAARGTTLEQLAAMYGKHRATVVRQLARVRAEVKEAILADVERQTKLGRTELQDALPLLQSRLDVSLSTLFASRD